MGSELKSPLHLTGYIKSPQFSNLGHVMSRNDRLGTAGALILPLLMLFLANQEYI